MGRAMVEPSPGAAGLVAGHGWWWQVLIKPASDLLINTKSREFVLSRDCARVRGALNGRGLCAVWVLADRIAEY
jgi:hypothetical protein